MPRRPATITQADIARAIRAAKQAGAAEVEVRVGHTSIVVRIASSTGVQSSLEASEQIVL
jgi:ATP phosphoribosyltransferase regulatory subunit HisZ